MPLHIFLSTWLGTTFGVLDFAKIAKELFLVAGFLMAIAASLKQPWFKELFKDKLVWLILAYGLLTVGLALIRPTDTDAEILGVVYNLRFLVFFGYGILLSRLFSVNELRRKALGVVLAAAAVVLIFGVVQYTLLPNDALTHVGYERGNGVLPVFLIDEKPDLERVMSTVRDPNSLGSYIIVVALLALVLGWLEKIPKQLAGGILALALLCLVFTFSRSAWLGFLVAVAVFWGIRYGRQLGSPAFRKYRLIALGVLVLAALSVYPLRDTYFVKNVIFHADESTVLEDPNELRTRFWRESVEDIAADPVGSGPGTAGLASIRNEDQGTELNENYYLQVASEVGVLGLGLFLAIIGIVGLRLLRLSVGDPMALALLASFAGLALTNLLVHIWSNEAVAYTWWGLVGLVIFTPLRTPLKN